MQLLLIRHAIAEDVERLARGGGNDADRSLTETGRKRMRKGANRLRSQVQTIHLLACSSLARARQTAEIVSRALGEIPIIEREDLAPHSDTMDSLLDWLTDFSPTDTIALVGHAPHLSVLAGVLLAALPRPLVNLKRGGAALMEFDEKVLPGAGTLRWALTPAQLRSLKD